MSRINGLIKSVLVFIIFYYSIPIASLSQGDVVYYEDFNNFSTVWTQYKKNSTNSTINKGVYIIKSSNKDALRQFYAQIFINYKKDFSIETKIKQVAGKSNQGYGLVWGAKGWKNSYFFIISGSGYFSIGKYSNGNFISIAPWTKSSHINPVNSYNVLKVEKKDYNLTFYINGYTVYSKKYTPFFGQMQGFMLQQGQTCYVDYLKISNDIPKLEIADINFKGIKKNIGTNINTRGTEIAPIISPDGKTLYFARGYSSTNPEGYFDEADIWYSQLQKDGTWGPAKNIGKPLNNSGVNVVVNAMPDGNTLFLEGLYNSDGTFKSDQGISVTHRLSDSTWSVPTQVRVDNFYNKNIYETYFFTTDQKVLILSVERDDTYGDLDLYVSFRRSDGSYTKPKNMGPDINTFGSDGTPFLAPDGKTLYFSTDGWNGYGSEDIYVSKRLDDTWLHWSKPKNLGPRINSDDWDTYFSLSAKGDTAFLVSTAHSFGNEDIFTIALSEQMQPEKVVLVYGKVIDQETKKPISATIEYTDLKTGEQVGIANSNPTTGEYKIILPYGKLYGIRAEAKNYIAISENLNLVDIGDYEEVNKDLYLKKVKIGEVIVLNNIFFERNSAVIDSTSFDELNRIVKIMNDNPTIKIELRGHTDNRGDKDLLMKLSKDRVTNVKKYLTSKGIGEERISTKAFGGTMPVNKDNTEEEHAKNRRVEFKILSI